MRRTLTGGRHPGRPGERFDSWVGGGETTPREGQMTERDTTPGDASGDAAGAPDEARSSDAASARDEVREALGRRGHDEGEDEAAIEDEEH